MLDPTPKTIYLKDYTPPAFLISAVELDIDIRDDHALVKARLAVSRNPKAADPNAPLELDGDELELQSVAIDGNLLRSAAFTLDSEHLTVPGVPDKFALETVVRIRPRQNTKLMGLYVSKDGYFTQCEAEGFRRITFFLDRPDVMARYTTTIHADKAGYAMSLRTLTLPSPRGRGTIRLLGGIGPGGKIRSRSLRICSRWWRRNSIGSKTASSPGPAAR
jgi:aminopeptidase N